jgi:hypothetical protein
MFLASCWLPKMDMTPKVAGTLRQRYAECRMASKMFRRPHTKMALYGYVMSTTSKVMYSMRGFLGVPKDTGSVIVPTGSILFLLLVKEGLRRFSKLLSVKADLIEGFYEENFGLSAVVNKDFGYVPFVNVDYGDHGVGM